MVEPTHKGMQVLTHLVFYKIILVCVCSVYFLGLNIFKNRLTHFYKTWDTNAHYNFGIRKFNIIHCQLRNEASNLKAHLFKEIMFVSTFLTTVILYVFIGAVVVVIVW
jgi:hypothetical protein